MTYNAGNAPHHRYCETALSISAAGSTDSAAATRVEATRSEGPRCSINEDSNNQKTPTDAGSDHLLKAGSSAAIDSVKHEQQHVKGAGKTTGGRHVYLTQSVDGARNADTKSIRAKPAQRLAPLREPLALDSIDEELEVEVCRLLWICAAACLYWVTAVYLTDSYVCTSLAAVYFIEQVRVLHFEC